MSPGVFLVAPPETAGDFISDGTSHVVTMAIPTTEVEAFERDARTRVGIRNEETFRDVRLMRRIVRLWRELRAEAPTSRLLADQVMRETLLALAQRTEARLPVRHGRERLATSTVRRVRDYVEDHLERELEVCDMAAVADLSPAHFARAFAATVGATPFDYVMTRRLARAHELLTRTDRRVLDVALDVGFKTPSHFAARFRREFGLTPREIRG
jgi:AraC family transcriptional regulator